MRKVNKNILIQIAINVGLSIIIFLTIFFVRYKIDHYVIDAFSLTGALLLLFACMKLVIHAGTFNLLGFWARKFSDFFRKTPKYNYKYYDYVEMKKDGKKIILWPSFLVGGIYLIIGIIMILITM